MALPIQLRSRVGAATVTLATRPRAVASGTNAGASIPSSLVIKTLFISWNLTAGIVLVIVDL
jgi:hypothetical protein